MKDDKVLYILLAVVACLAANYWCEEKYGMSLIDKIMGKEQKNPDPLVENTPQVSVMETAQKMDEQETKKQPTGTVYLSEIPSESELQKASAEKVVITEEVKKAFKEAINDTKQSTFYMRQENWPILTL